MFPPDVAQLASRQLPQTLRTCESCAGLSKVTDPQGPEPTRLESCSCLSGASSSSLTCFFTQEVKMGLRFLAPKTNKQTKDIGTPCFSFLTIIIKSRFNNLSFNTFIIPPT